MSFELTIRNYRCFQEPITLSIDANLTALIGANNSGKSSILRFFYEFRSIFEHLSRAVSGDELNSLLGSDRSTQNKPFSQVNTVSDYEEMFCDFNKGDIEFTITWMDESTHSKKLHEISITITVVRKNPKWHAELRIDETGFSHTIFGKIRLSGDLIEWGDRLTAPRTRIDSIFSSLVQTQYIGAFRNILNANPSGTSGGKNYFDLEMGSWFVDRWRRLKTGTRSEFALAARVTEDIRRIFGYERLEINAWFDNQTLQVIVNGRTHKLGELGSGIAQFIVVLANAALAKPSYILIDEPELNLHPSLQPDFITSLASYATEGVLFATHNVGLALNSADCIYTVRGTELTSKVSIYEQTPHLSEFLGELGFAAYQDLGFDSVLLVEGPSEVKLIGCWLRLYRLAHKVVLLHLGGSSSINGHSDAELQEIKRLSPRVFALIDSERKYAGEPLLAARQAFQDLCKSADVRCFVTERRATENYLADRAIKVALGPDFSALTEFQSLKEISPRWKKSDNWRIGAEMTLEELNATDLHELFNALVKVSCH